MRENKFTDYQHDVCQVCLCVCIYIYIYKCTVVLGLEKPMSVVAATTIDLSSFHLSHLSFSFYL